MRKLTNFWETLDMLADAALPAIDWRGAHPSDWQVIAPLLSNTGRRSTSVSCSSGGENCPRKVIELAGGRLVAECQEEPSICDTLYLTLDDICINRVDRSKFAGMVCRALDLVAEQQKQLPGGLFPLGRRDVVAGRTVTVFALFQGGSHHDKGLAALDALLEAAQPQLLLVPTSRTLSEDQKRYLARNGAEYRTFDDVLIANDSHIVSASAMAAELLDRLVDAVKQSLQTTASGLLWPLPPDAKWGDLKIAFISDHVINVTFRTETRRFEPSQLGMTNAKNGNPNLQWTWLKQFAEARGNIDIPVKPSARKQKEHLSKKLIAAFGIQDEPITAKARSYQTAYVTNADGLKQGRQGAHRRNIVDDG